MPIADYPIYKDVSIADFKEKFNAIERMDDKLDFIYSYLLCHGMDEGAQSCSFEELLHVAKHEFIKSSIALKDEYARQHNGEKSAPNVINPFSNNAEAEAMQTVFLADPLRFMQAMGASVGATPINDQDLSVEEQEQVNAWKENALRISEEINGLKIIYDNIEQDVGPSEVTERVGKRLFQREDVSVKEFLEHNKGGNWERFFGTTSKEYKAFAASFEAFNSVDNPNFGEKNMLRSATTSYLKRKFPNLEEGQLPTAEQIAAVSNATTKGRIEFAVAVIQELNAQERIEEMANAFANIDLDNPNPQQDPQQEEFQQQIAKDLAKDFVDENIEVQQDDPVVENGIDMN